MVESFDLIVLSELMSLYICQTFTENVSDFEMSVQEAYRDALAQLEMQG